MEVSEHERVLIVLSYLATRKPFFFYRAIEKAGIWSARRMLNKHYRQIIVLRGQEAGYKAFVHSVNTLAADVSVKAIDVIINLHGSRNTLVFAPHTHISYDAIVFSDGATQKLRLMYSTACYAAAGNKFLLKAGFRTAIGAGALNINALTEYPALLLAWAHGYNVDAIIRKAAGPLGRLTDIVGRIISNEVASRKVVAGNAGLTISTMPGAPLA
jgi:hypothetical protein